MISSNNFVIEDLIFVPMGHHNPMQMRPYTIHATEDAANAIANQLVESNQAQVTPELLKSFASEIVQPSAIGFDSVVNHDWVGTKRFAFVMKVRSTSAYGDTINSYFQGYTNYDGISHGGHADEAMLLVVNSVIETIVVEQRTPLGINYKERLHKRYSVMGSTGGLGGGYEASAFTQRPQDIMDTIEADAVRSLMYPDYSEHGIEVADDQFNGFGLPGMKQPEIDIYTCNNVINPFSSRTIGSDISNSIPSVYLRKTLNAGIMNNYSNTVHIGGSEISSGSIAGMVSDPELSDNQFMVYLTKSLTGRSTVSEVFHFGALVELDPTIQARFKYVQLNKDIAPRHSLDTPEVGEYWHGQDMTTIKAYSIIESAVATAMHCGFNAITFTATNMSSPLPGTELVITNFNSFVKLTEQDMVILLEDFKQSFDANVFVPETKGGIVPMYLEVYVDLLGTSKVMIQYANDHPTWYTAPTIANSAYTPVLTVDKNTVDMLGYGFSALIDEVTHGARKQQQMNY